MKSAVLAGLLAVLAVNSLSGATQAPVTAAAPAAQQQPAVPAPPATATPPAQAAPATPSPGDQPATLPPAATQAVDFTRDIKPILQTSCVRCHGRGKSRGGFSMESRDTLLKGGDTGPAVIDGKSADSYLISLVAGTDPDEVMPQKGSRLKPEQVGLLRAWIDQGMPWDPAVTFAKAPPQNLQRRQPELPAAAAGAGGSGVAGGSGGGDQANPIDRLLAPHYAKERIDTAATVDDRLFARRLYFDLIGLPPTPAELRTFVADRRPDKRARLAARLLADNTRYAEHWLSFWNDALRNDYRGPGYIDGGRTQISVWLYNALLTNLPYDQFVAQLINPADGAEGFTKGIIWRGVVNASQTPPMQAAQNISQVFMGVNLKCASCHDSFINDWQLSDAYGLASIYADAPLGMVECDRPTGKTAAMKFLYPELGGIDAAAARPARLDQLARLMTSEKNGRLSRTIVNRLWTRFMGYGLVATVDDMEQPAWSPDLLDWLAEDLIAHHYDLKQTIQRIVTSRAYQRPAIDLPEPVEHYTFRGPAIRRLSAEQFVDALSAVTGLWQARPDKTIRLVASHGGPTAGPARLEYAPVKPAKAAPTPAKTQAAATSVAPAPDAPIATGSAITASGPTAAEADATSATQGAPAPPKPAPAAAAEDETKLPQPAWSAQSRTRAALVAADPLMLALGRPNREQVLTTRAAAATTLQALELVNGGTLAAMLKSGAKQLLADKPTRAVLIDRIYRRGLGRGATPAEAALARDLLGPAPTPEGVQDLLWAVVMLPEFQLIS